MSRAICTNDRIMHIARNPRQVHIARKVQKLHIPRNMYPNGQNAMLWSGRSVEWNASGPHRQSALTRTGGMVASQHIAIQGHRHKDIKKIRRGSLGHSRLLRTATGDIETVADTHKNTSWKDMRTTRNGPSNLLGKE